MAGEHVWREEQRVLKWLMTAIVAGAIGAPPGPHEPPPMDLPVKVYQSACLEMPVCEIKGVSDGATTAVATGEVEPQAEAEVETVEEASVSTPSVDVPESVEAWRGLVASYFPADQVDKALAVMDCESGGDPTAYNPSTATGLMQVHWETWGEYYGVSIEDLMDPETNIRIAADIYITYGWSHWSCA